MTFFPLLKKQSYGLLDVIAVSIFSIAFSVLTIYSVNDLDKGLNIVTKHPLKVSAALYNVHKAASDIETRLARLSVIIRQMISPLSATMPPPQCSLLKKIWHILFKTSSAPQKKPSWWSSPCIACTSCMHPC